MSTLLVPSSVQTCFVSCQNGSLRWIQLQIENESFTLMGTGKPTDNAALDFQSLYSKFTEPLFILFCCDVNVQALRWHLLAYVPDDANVRDKMLYSSSREGLKQQLGYNYFIGEFHFTSVDEFTYDNFISRQKCMDHEAPLTENERLQKEEAALERDTSVKSTAMGIVPFHIVPACTEALKAFHKTINEGVIMVLNAETESVELLQSMTSGATSELLTQYLDPIRPCFVVFRPSTETTYFIFSCPEEAPIRAKMMASTCKATVLSSLQDMDIVTDHMIEIRSIDELPSVWSTTAVAAPVPTDAPKFSKPSAPGRRARGRVPPRT